jgi:uncharacterized secreted protein with C-terminal beta-propeller domain
MTDYVSFYVENPMYIINGEKAQIDAENPKIAPYMKNGQIYIPVRIIAEAFGGNVEWLTANKTAVIRDKNGNFYKFTENSDEIDAVKKNNAKETIKMNASAELRDGRLYVPAASAAEIFGKSMFYERGLIVIANKNQKPKNSMTAALIEEFTGIVKVGTKDKFVQLVGYDPSDDYFQYYRFAVDGVDMPMAMDMIESEMEAPTGAPAPTADSNMVKNNESSDADSPAGESTSDFSETNTQVQGVDEADIIKTDGQYIYYVRSQTIEIVKANSDGSLEFMSSFKMQNDNYFNFSEIFIDGVRIIAIGTTLGNDGQYVKAVVINTEDKKSPVFERSVEVKGYYVTSRKIGNSVYFVANQYFWYWYGGDVMPVYRDTAAGDKYIEVGYDGLYCFPNISGSNITSLVGFNIDRPNEEAFIETFLGCGENIYMSANAMYIASSSYNENGNETIINKFAVDDGKFVFVKNGSAPGTILNQFSMDEYKSHFRIATTVSQYSPTWKEYNGLYIFDSTMELVGRIDDIAPGERIYSARFMGDRGYMVTFKTVDPLFAIDLSDPTNPVVMGALKIPGYSNYLHPYDENHLIGIGKDTVVDIYNNAFYTSMKISLFDVTDITNPIEMFVETIGERGTDSPLLYNHKALLFSKEKNLLAFPVTVYEYNSNQKAVNGQMPDFGTFAFSGAYIYDIDLINGFTLRGAISHMSSQDMLQSSYWGGNPDLYIQRLLTIRENLYAASDKKLTSHNLNTLYPIDELIFGK